MGKLTKEEMDALLQEGAEASDQDNPGNTTVAQTSATAKTIDLKAQIDAEELRAKDAKAQAEQIDKTAELKAAIDAEELRAKDATAKIKVAVDKQVAKTDEKTQSKGTSTVQQQPIKKVDQVQRKDDNNGRSRDDWQKKNQNFDPKKSSDANTNKGSVRTNADDKTQQQKTATSDPGPKKPDPIDNKTQQDTKTQQKSSDSGSADPGKKPPTTPPVNPINDNSINNTVNNNGGGNGGNGGDPRNDPPQPRQERSNLRSYMFVGVMTLIVILALVFGAMLYYSGFFSNHNDKKPQQQVTTVVDSLNQTIDSLNQVIADLQKGEQFIPRDEDAWAAGLTTHAFKGEIMIKVESKAEADALAPRLYANLVSNPDGSKEPIKGLIYVDRILDFGNKFSQRDRYLTYDGTIYQNLYFGKANNTAVEITVQQ
jgi:hypothetical protein